MRHFANILILTICSGTATRVSAADTLMPSIIHEACSEYKKGAAFEIQARFQDESQLFDPKAIFRGRADSHWKHAPFNKKPGTEDFVALIDAKELQGPLEYFIEVFDEYGNGPARMGSPEAPIRVMPSSNPAPCQQIPKIDNSMATTSGSLPSLGTSGTKTSGPGIGLVVPAAPKGPCDVPDRPLYCEAWLWSVVGGVVLAGTGTAIYFLVFAGKKTPPAERTKVDLTLTGPDPTTLPLLFGGRQP